MLKQFSWGHFLAASVMLNLVWYGFVLLVFYRKELLTFLGNKGSGAAFTVAHARLTSSQIQSECPKDDSESGNKKADVSLMGVSKLPDGVEVLSCSQLALSGRDASDRYDQVGLVADVVQELKIIFSELEKTASDKRDFFRLLAKVKEEYGPLSGHPSLGAINSFITERAGFLLTSDEMDSLWY